MSDMSNWSGTGRLGKDPETRKLPNGDDVCNFRIAVNGFRKDDPATWIGVSLFGKSCAVARYLHKGSRIAVTGRLSVREYERRDGTKGTDVEVRANDVTLLDAKGSGGGDTGTHRQRGEDTGFADDFPPDDFGSRGGGGGAGADDDIPFRHWDMP